MSDQIKDEVVLGIMNLIIDGYGVIDEDDAFMAMKYIRHNGFEQAVYDLLRKYGNYEGCEE